jgi:DNA modification methylase
MTTRLMVGHVIDELRKLKARSVHMVWTSPPYWGLRSYGTEPQVWGGKRGCKHRFGRVVARKGGVGRRGENSLIQSRAVSKAQVAANEAGRGQFCCCGAWRGEHGLEPTFKLWLRHEVEIFREVRRVLRDDGTLWVNIGDAYAGSPNGWSADETKAGGGDDRTFRDKPNSTVGAAPGGGTIKPKDRLLMPSELARALRRDGWWLRDEVILHKQNPMPSSIRNRTCPAHEYLYMLTKSGRPQFWTHRDLPGVRSKPKPDYRWLDLAQYPPLELAEPPADWREATMANPRGGEPVKRYRRVNLWEGHDYYYDDTAIAEPFADDRGGADYRRRDYKMPDNWDTAPGRHDGPHRTGRETGKRPIRGRDSYGRHTLGAALPAGERRPVSVRNRGGRSDGFTKPNDIDPSANGGRLKRSVWSQTLEPFKEAHFATAPTGWVRPCVMAGTSVKGVCPHCGAPWSRVTVASQAKHSHAGRRGTAIEGKGHPTSQVRATHDVREGPVSLAVTVGFRPTCGCENNKPVSATVLDPFGGAGTTALVAEQIERDSILIELHSGYARLARKRLRMALAHVASKLPEDKPEGLPLFDEHTSAAAAD